MARLIGFLTLAACFILAGALLDGGYQRSTPGSLQAQGTIVDFERRHSRQVYPVFEFKDADGSEGDLMYLGGWKSMAMVQRYGRSAAASRARKAARRISIGDRL